ncbi:MAG: TonB-dependent receptor [Bacteroidetes bacterium]|nr:TonB-dependent receptor [Bacteroidota bacterium]
MRWWITICMSIGMVLSAGAQCNLLLSGHIDDADTKEHLVNATILIKELKISALTDSAGFFRFQGLCAGTYTLIISHAGCKSITKHIHLKSDYEFDLQLDHHVAALQEVVVTGDAGGGLIESSNLIKGNQLKATRGLSLAESIRGIAGVTMFQTGTNIYKPVIHGLHSNRILILNNGIRQEGQQWGSEHAPEIDPFIANRLSVVKGSGVLRYGGDAIAGVVLVEPKLLPTDPGIRGEVNLAAFSNNRMGAFSGMLEGNSARDPAFSWRMQGTFRRGGNAQTPNYILGNSGTEEMNFSATAGWQEKERGVELFYSQFNTKLGIFSGAHIGNVTDLWNSIRQKDPPDYIRNVDFTYAIERPYQQIRHQLLKMKAWKNTGDIGRLNVIMSGQLNERQEYDIKRFASSSNAPQLNMSIGTFLTDLVWDHYNTGAWRGTVGASVMMQNNWYRRRLFIPNYQSLNVGVFAIEKYTYRKLDVEGGVRFDYKTIYNTTDNEDKFNYPDLYFSNLSGTLGLHYRYSNALKASFNTSTVWRSPQVNELYANGLHQGAARIERGNAGMQPERSYNIASTINYTTSFLEVGAGVYLKNINGFIFLRPDFPPELTIRGAFPVFMYQQTDARLHGLDFNATAHIWKHVDLIMRASVLRAWDMKANDWLIQMPADRLEGQLTYRLGNTGKIHDTYFSVSGSFVARQIRVPGKGNIEIPDTNPVVMQSDYLAPPPQYFLAGMEWGTKIRIGHQVATVILGVTNLFDRAYRDYMNAFRYFSDEMGRNISLRLHIPFVIIHQHK